MGDLTAPEIAQRNEFIKFDYGVPSVGRTSGMTPLNWEDKSRRDTKSGGKILPIIGVIRDYPGQRYTHTHTSDEAD